MSLPTFTNTTALWLLLLIPLFMYIGWPRVPYRKRRDAIALGIRIILIIVIVLGLAGLQIRQQADKLAVVFLVDHSDSMDAEARAAAKDYIESSIESMTEDDQAAVILFGSNALIEEPIDDVIDIEQYGAETNVVSLNTDFEEAIQLGLALFPADSAKRLVILSDGLETVGDAERAAQLAEASSVQIEYVEFSRRPQPDVLVSNVSVPTTVGQGEPFDMVITVESETSTTATLRVYTGGDPDDDGIRNPGEETGPSGRLPLYQREVQLNAGTNRFVISPLQWNSVGFVDLQVQIEPTGVDNFERNNTLWAFTRVTGQPRILVVTSDADEIQYLEPALAETGFAIDVLPPEDVPLGLAPLSAYSSIVLANVSATDMSPDLMELFEIYVRDLGGGMVAIGGPDSFGVGGYFETPLERTLPVEMRIKDRERIPQLSLVFVIDRSGSMEVTTSDGITSLSLAKEAVIRSFNFLNDYDRAGVISFDTQAFWVVDIQDIGNSDNRAFLQNEIARLRPGGGTDIFGGLSSAADDLPDDPSELKHIILLTDGGANPSGIVPLVNRMFTNHQITTSVVAVGANYEPWLQQIPQQGGGTFHVATNVQNIPTIFAQEIVLTTREYIIEDPFTPVLTARSPIMDGIQAAPQLQGYIGTTGKDTATVILSSPEPNQDPILASWQYGLGRSVAFTSDATARWGNEWVSWEEYSRFWNQVVRWTITEGTNNNLEISVDERGEDAFLVVDARDNRGQYLNTLQLDAAVVYPDRQSESITLQQVAPGRYEAPFTPTRDGAYFVRVAGQTRADANIQESVAQTTGWVLSYSAEYRPSPPNSQFLDRLSAITSGGSLEGNEAGVFAHNLDAEEAAMPLWPYLLSIAALLLIFDIAVRRVVINRSDIERIRETVGSRFGGGTDYQETESSSVMSSLKQAKQRAGQSDEDEEDVKRDNWASFVKNKTSGTSTKKTTPKPASTPEPSDEGGTLASKLLKKKRDEE